jgi:hypothetical protein
MTQVDIKKELKSIVLQNYNKIPSSRGDDLSSYFEVALIWLAEWVAEKQFRSDVKPGYCVFVLAPDIVTGEIPEGAEETYYFKEDTTPVLGGNMYLTDYALNRVLRYPDACRDLTDIVALINKKNVSDRPFLVFDVDTQTVYVFSDGVAAISLKFPLRADIPHPFTLDVFVKMLNDIYRLNLKYPERYPGVWHDAQMRVPCKATELLIQSHVCAILKARAQGSKKSASESEWLTIVEEKTNAGRVDISVYRDSTCVVVSELKVLRHCHCPEDQKRNKKRAAAKTNKERDAAMKPRPVSAAFNEKWAMRGARQAARYKNADAAESAALVLYDMRDNDADIPAVQAQCRTDGVRYVRYYLHNELNELPRRTKFDRSR